MNSQSGVGGFREARPVWPVGLEREMNGTAGFAVALPESVAGDAGGLVLRVTASTSYRAFCQGRFLGCGPARAAHGYFRVDEWPLAAAGAGTLTVAVEVAGYNVNSYATLDQPSFLQAEIVAGDGRVLAATGTGTGGAAFLCQRLPQRLQKVVRYSFQRAFSEHYRLAPGWDAWRTAGVAPEHAVVCAEQPAVNLLPRRVPYPDFACRAPVAVTGAGRLERGLALDAPWRIRFLDKIGPRFRGWRLDELEADLPHEMERWCSRADTGSPPLQTGSFTMVPGSYQILDFGTNGTGFIGLKIVCAGTARLVLAFDELLTEGDVDWKRMSCSNLAAWDLVAGQYTVESFEPYTFRYLKVMVTEATGPVTLAGVHLRDYINPDVWRAHFAASDPRLNRIFAAARNTYAQNTVDIFMDCPGRERAGWLCDSFFMGRVERLLAGHSLVETNFLENYALPERFEHLPEGMVPMCYPSDHDDRNFIPNWALWLVLELEEYLAGGGDPALVARLRPRVLGIFDYFRPFLNTDGLLEKLEGWVFVEWSMAGNFVQDVNFPTNLLYAGALDAAGRIYQLPEFRRQADQIRAAVRRLSFDGEFFVDNAERQPDGTLKPTRNRSEVCQYHAFYFGAATPETHPELWRRLAEEFGPGRETTGAWPEIHKANAFIGNVLRLELLARTGRPAQVVEEASGFLLYMVDRTGTLWENQQPRGSCNHGFASHACHMLYRDALGIRSLNPVAKRVTLAPGAVPLAWCEGSIPVGNGRLVFRWWRDDEGRLHHEYQVPSGFDVTLELPEKIQCPR